MPSQPMHAFNYGVLTVSDGASRGYRVDTSGELIESTLTQQGLCLRQREVVPDDFALITGWLRRWAPHVDLIVTTGGTGLGPRDVTPEATMRAIERPVPGLAEALRDETPSQNATGRPEPRRGGHPGALPDRQPSRQSEGGRRVPGGPPARPAPRPGHGTRLHGPPPPRRRPDIPTAAARRTSWRSTF